MPVHLVNFESAQFVLKVKKKNILSYISVKTTKRSTVQGPQAYDGDT